ncbi:MAG: UDP-N-acetylmuramoyl-L-alanine--D-glutamate ligase, partial [Verrucomicrobiae bacterium]|nr:UDP-N-acetylmuramoyl-L-alanine--D-glutamate ligase [Verrucomicrobiae bacterium]
LEAAVSLFSKRGIEVLLGADRAPAKRFDLAVLSPGVDPARPVVKSVVESGTPLIGELEAGFLFCRCPLVGLTGTNGKTTTTELIDVAFRSAGKLSRAVGNIGTPLTEACVDSDRYEVFVVEISSFQLETIRTFRPKVSVMMNITPDHLDRYPDMETYARAKGRLWDYQRPDDWAVMNVDSENYLGQLGIRPKSRVLRYALRAEPFADYWCEGSKIHRKGEGVILDSHSTKLRGVHNAENLMAALAAAEAWGLDRGKILPGLCEYRAQPHRLETVRVVNGVEYINDSKATNLDAMEKALTAFDAPIHLIVGGKDKGFDFKEVLPQVRQKVRTALLVGQMADKIQKLWDGQVDCVRAGTVARAVELASERARSGEIVLLSPGCSSYDQFHHYEERGQAFRDAVAALRPKSNSTHKESQNGK